jgi:FkbM family methyltransferase
VFPGDKSQKLSKFLIRVNKISDAIGWQISLDWLRLTPPPIKICYPIQFDRIEFKYCSDLSDDLNKSARLSFRDWEPETLNFLMSIAPALKCIVDVGAYSGVISILCAKVNAGAVVHAFEPNPYACKLLIRNVQANNLSNVTLHKLALSNITTKQNLYLKNASGVTATSSLERDYPNNVAIEGEVISVNTCTLDEYFESSIDLVKIDVEGHELQVLQGMRQHLLNSHPIVVTEALTYNELFKQVQFLQEFGYTMPINLDQRNFVFRIQ